MFRTLSLVFVTLIPALASHAQSPEVPAEVTEVRSFGAWQTGERGGHYRLVVTGRGFEHVRSELYVEWITETEKGSVVAAATPVKEINDVGVYVVGVESVEQSEVRLRLTNVYSQEVSALQLRLGSPGEYTAEAM